MSDIYAREMAAMPRPSTQYLARLRKAFESGKDSDLTILCGSEQFRVHKFQLSQHSEVFDNMLNGRFSESKQREIELKEDAPTALREVFRFMYTFQYNPATNSPLLHLRVAALADKYFIAGLGPLAFEQFAHAFGDCTTDVLAETIEQVYACDELEKYRPDLVKLVSTKLHVYKARPEDYEAFWSVVEKLHAFAVDLLRAPAPLGSRRSSMDCGPPSPSVQPQSAGFNPTSLPYQWTYGTYVDSASAWNGYYLVRM